MLENKTYHTHYDMQSNSRLAVAVVVLLKLKQTNPDQVTSGSQADFAKQTHVDLSHTRRANRAREPDTRCGRGNLSKGTFFTLTLTLTLTTRTIGAVIFIRPTVAVVLVVGDGEVDGRHSDRRLLCVGVCCVGGFGLCCVEQSRWCLYTNLRVERVTIFGTIDTGSTKKDRDKSVLMKELLSLSTKSQGPNNEAFYHNNRHNHLPHRRQKTKR
jgi:hypothetical protein